MKVIDKYGIQIFEYLNVECHKQINGNIMNELSSSIKAPVSNETVVINDSLRSGTANHIGHTINSFKEIADMMGRIFHRNGRII